MDSAGPTKLEFAVQMTCESCADKVRAALEGKAGVTSVSVDVGKERVLVESALTSAEVQALIESTGRRAVLKGIGGSEHDLGSAVAMLAGGGRVQGVVRFLQLSEQRCLIDGTIDGLEPGPHGLHVHTLGDLTLDCLRLACGIIARSAGLFQNPKQICACDGVTLWEERDRPLAGKGRSKAGAETPAANL
ncbi:Copper chaperone for superoxide dismutase [Liparis tanakae]|uniref:Superoxide dismutase copper chaperone n=1 Tax=Liparis tanakae TaxID=230148 RepID=A0A4Z2FE95_9TELE|nr:Copper chaperone for superoxide dismutase [Liparis tanakae]